STEELKIDLDAELKKADAGRAKPKTKASPFELSESDLELPAKPAAKKSLEDSSDPELQKPAAAPKKSLQDSSDPDFSLAPESGSLDEISVSEIVLEEEGGKKPAKGGEKASKAADSGLKLKDSDAGSPSSSDEIEFELGLDSDGGLEPETAAKTE